MERDPQVVAVQDWLEAHRSEMLSDFRDVLQIPSLESEALEGAPYGLENRRALDWALAKCSGAGWRVRDLEGHIGWGEFGSGERMVMTLGHLDVVPVGPGWKHDPFGAEVEDGWVYARGASDDKGPTVAMLWAAKALHAVVGDPGVRVRSVFGCNEESGFGCVHRYMQTEEAPTLGVAPDAGWPCIHGEKGIADFVVERPLPHGELTVLEIRGGQRPNIVIDHCVARVEVADSVMGHVRGKVAESWDRNLCFEWEGAVLRIEARGKAAHGSYPWGGDNAAVRVFRFLKEAAPLSQELDLDKLHELGHIGGSGLGIAGSDAASGALTCNLGIVETVEGRLRLTLNVRYPVTWDGSELREKVEAHLLTLPDRYWLEGHSDSMPLYFPVEHPLVRTMVDVYAEETGERREPRTMGGGTYARAVPNCVAIGTGWEGDGPAHETDERMSVEHFYKMARIYGHVLIRLCREAATL